VDAGPWLSLGRGGVELGRKFNSPPLIFRLNFVYLLKLSKASHSRFKLASSECRSGK
jgi:hypothetical protein